MRRTAAVRCGALAMAGATFAAVVAAEAGGEAAPVQFQDRVDVRLVQVDAWATDSGQPVLDLEQSELRLTEDGKPVEILYFAAPVAELAPPRTEAPASVPDAPPAAEAAGPEPAVVALFVDEAHLGLGSRARTLAALREWVAGGGLPAHADAMLVSFERELRVVQGRTRDRARLLAAIDGLGGASTLAIEGRMEERRALERIHEMQRAAIEAQRDAKGANSELAQANADDAARADTGEDVTIYFDPPCTGRLLQVAEELASTVAGRSIATLESLGSFADSLAALRGRKILVFVSEGMSSRPGGAAFDYVRTLCDGSGVRAGIQYAIDVQAQAGPGALRGQLSPAALALAGEDSKLLGTVDRVVARANSSGVSVWSFGASGLSVSGSDASAEYRTATPDGLARQKGEAEDVLNALAADTGGRAVLEANDFGAALGDLADDLFRAYSIAFASPRAGDGRLHQIRLETTRPGVRLRYRRSWRDSSSEDELAGLVGGALAFGIDRPGLQAVATVGRRSGQGGEQRLILRLTLPRSAVTAVPGERGGERGLLRLAIALRPEGGESTPVRTKLIPVEIAAGSAASESIVHDIALPQIGRGALIAVGLRDEVSGEIGVFRVEVGGS